MKRLKGFLNVLMATLLMVPPVHGATRVVDMDEANGSRSFEGFALNAGWEQSTLYWSASGGTYGRGSSESFRGDYSGNWDSSGASQTLTGTSKTKFSKEQNGIARLWIFQTGATVPTHKLQVVQGSTVLNEVVISTVQDKWKKNEVSFIFPSTGAAPQVRLISVAADEPNIRIDNLEFGLNDGLFQVSQAKIALRASYATNCAVQTTSTTFITPSNGTCSAPTIQISQVGTWDTSDQDAPQIQGSNLPPGIYTAHFNPQLIRNNTAGFHVSTRIKIGGANDNAVGGNQKDAYGINGEEFPVTLAATHIINPGDTTTVMFRVQIASEGGGTSANVTYGGSASNSAWEIDYQPLSSDLVMNNTLDSLGNVFYVAQSTCPSGSLVADGSAVSRSTYGPLFGRIGTTHGVGDGSTTFNLPDLRGIFVRGSGSQTISAQTFTGTLGAKQTDDLESHNHTQNAHNHGVTDPGHTHSESVPSRTVAQDESDGNAARETSSAQSSITYTSGSSTTGLSVNNATATNNATGGSETKPANISLTACISFATTAAPPIIGSVTSNSGGAERMERAQLVCSATSSINQQSGSWISSIGNISSGTCTVTIASGIFPQTPVCVYSTNSSNNGATFGNQLQMLSATSFTITGVYNIGGTTTAATNFTNNVICMGSR